MFVWCMRFNPNRKTQEEEEDSEEEENKTDNKVIDYNKFNYVRSVKEQ